MANRCLLDAIDQLRRSDIDPELRDVAVHTLTRIAEDNTRSQTQTQAALVAASRELRRQAYIMKVSTQVQEAKTEALLTRLAAIKDVSERAKTWRGILEGAGDYSRIDGNDIASLIRSREGEVLGALNEVWDYVAEARILRGGGTIRESANAHQFNRALHGATEGVDPEAIRLAKVWKAVLAPLLKEMRANGKYVGLRDDWGYQSHSPSKIASNYAEWRAYFIKHADPVHHPDPEATADALFQTLSTRHLDDGGSGSFSFGRQIFFKTPEAAADYTARFGDQGVHFGLLSKVKAIVRESVLTRELGPLHARALETVADRMEREAAQALQDANVALAQARRRGDRDAIQAAKREVRKIAGKHEGAIVEVSRAKMIAGSLTGALARPDNMQAAHVMGAARNWMVAQYLGQVPMAMLGTDSLISVIGGRFHAQ